MLSLLRSTQDMEGNAFHDQKRLIRASSPTIVDVGAHVGRIAAKYRAVFPNAKIVAVEPFPDSYAILSRNALGETICVNAALASSVGRAILHVNRDSSCNSLLPKSEAGRYYAAAAAEQGDININTTTLDVLAENLGISNIDILKIDVEGAEMTVLDGAKKLLAEHRVELIYTEVMFVGHYAGGCLFHSLTARMAELGYSLYNVYSLKSARNGQLRWGNAIYINPRTRSRIEAA